MNDHEEGGGRGGVPSRSAKVSRSNVLSRKLNNWAKMTNIESSMTKVLVATRELVEVLNEWSKFHVSENDVSDIYVKVVNEFNMLKHAFTISGIDMSDLQDIPDQLRSILEQTLSNDASKEVLDRYLPNIRETTVNLLQGLKRKQARHRIKVNGEAIQNRQTDPRRHTPTYYRPSTGAAGQSHRFSLVNSRPSTGASNISTSSPSRQLDSPQIPQQVQRLAPPDSIIKDDHESGALQRDSLSKLERREALGRRASKRFSDYNFGKLDANQHNNSRNNTPHHSPNMSLNKLKHGAANNNNNNGELAIVVAPSFEAAQTSPISATKTPAEYICVSPPPQTEVSASGAPVVSRDITLLLRLGDTTKKVVYDGSELTIAAIQLMFMEKFEYTPGQAPFPDILIRDVVSGADYVLEDLADVASSALLSIKPSSAFQDQIISQISELQTQQTLIMEKLSTEQPRVTSAPSGIVSASANLSPIKDYRDQVTCLKADLTSVLSSYDEFTSDITKSIVSLKQSKLTSMPASSLQLERGEMESVTQTLVSQLEELSDLVEDMRVDITQRQVRPAARNLTRVKQESAEAKAKLDALVQQMEERGPVWKEQWETQLQDIIEEQKFLFYTQTLVGDLQKDVEDVIRVFDDVQQCVEILNSQPRPLDVEEPEAVSPLQSRSAMLNQVKALNPDHESRVRAIAKAEEDQVRDRSVKRDEAPDGRFRRELEGFVGDNKLRPIGGVEAIDKTVSQREEQARRQTQV